MTTDTTDTTEQHTLFRVVCDDCDWSCVVSPHHVATAAYYAHREQSPQCRPCHMEAV